jgi:hypothetical protein
VGGCVECREGEMASPALGGGGTDEGAVDVAPAPVRVGKGPAWGAGGD